MKHMIPNQEQYDLIRQQFEIKYPKMKSIGILPTGMVVNRRHNSGSTIIGFITDYEGDYLRAISTHGPTVHKCIYAGRREEPATATELEIRELQDRVSYLERQVRNTKPRGRGLFG